MPVPAEHNHIHDTTYIVTLIDIIQQNLRALIVNVNVQCAMLSTMLQRIKYSLPYVGIGTIGIVEFSKL